MTFNICLQSGSLHISNVAGRALASYVKQEHVPGLQMQKISQFSCDIPVLLKCKHSLCNRGDDLDHRRLHRLCSSIVMGGTSTGTILDIEHIQVVLLNLDADFASISNCTCILKCVCLGDEGNIIAALPGSDDSISNHLYLRNS